MSPPNGRLHVSRCDLLHESPVADELLELVLGRGPALGGAADHEALHQPADGPGDRAREAVMAADVDARTRADQPVDGARRLLVLEEIRTGDQGLAG